MSTKLGTSGLKAGEHVRISERATPRPAIAEIPESEKPLSEQFRVAARAWVEAEAAAQLMEDLKTTTLEQYKQALIEAEGDMPDSHAERRVKARPDWEKYIRDMVTARKDANFAKVRLDWIRMRFSEWQARDANSRAEMRMTR